MKKKVLILANKYPNPLEPTTNTFIQQLAFSFSDMNLECVVVCPLPTNINKKYKTIDYYRKDITENKNEITIFHPRYFSFGQRGKFLQKLRVWLTTRNYYKAVDKIVKKMSKKPDFIYSYFLCPTSVVGSKLGMKYHIPAFMEHGEGLYEGNNKYGNKKLKKLLLGLNGVIAVSNQNKNYLINAGIVNENKIVVYPNCYRKERFYNMDKKIARKFFGWNDDDFIVGYAGRFDYEKGTLRLQSAVDLLDNVYFACAGSGNDIPTSDKCIFAKPVEQQDLVYFYNALDVYVLPTLVEGSCTATAEAIGCGCPIISSNREFNENLCFPDNSIKINPNNIDEIKDAINKLYMDRKMLKELSEGSLKHANDLRQDIRMKNVYDFMIKMSK